MTGAEHYAEAEKAIKGAVTVDDIGADPGPQLLLLAQAHALLALADEVHALTQEVRLVPGAMP